MTEKDEDPARSVDQPERRSYVTEPRELGALPACFRAHDVRTAELPGDVDVGRSSEEARQERTPSQGVNDPGVPLGELAWRFDKVAEQLAKFHRRSAHRESVTYRLHEENQRFRGGIGWIVLEPEVADLIRLYDQLDREARRLEAEGRTDGCSGHWRRTCCRSWAGAGSRSSPPSPAILSSPSAPRVVTRSASQGCGATTVR